METTQTPSVTEQPKVETVNEPILDRLSRDFGGDTPVLDTTTPVVEKTIDQIEGNKTTTEPTAEEKLALSTKAKELGLPETATKEEVAAAEAKVTPVTKEDEWTVNDVKIENQTPEDGSWKALATEFGFEIPEDFSEEKGFEFIQTQQASKIEAAKLEAIEAFNQSRFADVPEKLRSEAQLVVDLMKTGQTIEQINAPYQEIKTFKAMTDEQLVRNAYENTEGFDADMVDHKMTSLAENGGLAIEAKILRNNIDAYEKTLNTQRESQIKQYNENQQKLQQQKNERSNLELKTALDKVQTFLGKKITPDLKNVLVNELTSGAYKDMPGTPESKVGYFLYEKFGKQALQAYQDKVLADITLKNAQTKHNVPPVTTGNANHGDKSQNQNLSRVEREFGS